MNTKYWKQRWADGRTGWHRDDVNPHLIEYWSRLGVASSSKVLVPLCGQSLDLHWLADQGHEVVGVEASELALQGLPQHQNLSLHCGDFFKFNDP
ncbi:MAG: thiopurine S-methyltransferase, partial [Planctomycetota bacterium]|nr:thiopurine S-methyltransferase [Planctomycetota bacterium]